MKLLGANNIVITPIVEQKEGKVDKDDGKKDVEEVHAGPHLPRRARRSRRRFPTSRATSSEVVVNSVITREGHHRSGKIVGVDSSYFDVMNLKLAEGGDVRAAALRGGVAGGDHRAGREVALLHDARTRSASTIKVGNRVAHRRRRARGSQGLGGDGEGSRHSRREHGRLHPAADDAAALSQSRRGHAAGDGARGAAQRSTPPIPPRPTTSAPRSATITSSTRSSCRSTSRAP